MPGMRKICSVTIAPPNTAGICRATSVTTGDEGVAGDVPERDGALAEPLGARRRDVVEPGHVEHRRADVAGVGGGLEEAQHAATGMMAWRRCSHHQRQPVAEMSAW